MIGRLRLAIVLAVAAAAAAGHFPARAQTKTYTVVDLGPPPGYGGYLADINEFGTLVGVAFFSTCCPIGTYYVPFVIENGVLSQLPFRGTSTGLAVNDHGEIAGTNSTTHRAFRYANGSAIDLGTAGENSFGTGINFSGNVVGYGPTSRAFVHVNGSLQVLPFDLSSNPVINDSGQLAGNQLYSGGLLIPFAASGSFQAQAINSRGDVVGVRKPSDEAFLFSNDKLSLLGKLPGHSYSYANDINDAGVMVGRSSESSGSSRAFIVANGTMTDLNDLATAPAGFTLSSAAAINESGYIATQLSNSNQTVTRLALLVPNTPSAPSFKHQPESVWAVAGSKATFFAVAKGVPLPTYQWQSSPFPFTTWTDITDNSIFSGAATPRLTVSSAAETTTYFAFTRFRAVATNATGPIASAAVELKVTSATVGPAIATQPGARISGTGNPATFSVAASGTAPLSYQWRRNGADIPGAVYPTLLITALQSAHAGTYTVTVSNSAGSVTSSGASLRILKISPASLNFGAERSSVTGQVTTITAPQDVSVDFSGAGTEWTALKNQPWVVFSNGSGTGSGRFTVGIDAAALPAATSQSAVVTLSVGGISGPRYTAAIPLTVTTQPAPSAAAPFGAFDTPTGSSTVAGSVAVTGWALDDVGVSRVELWRDLVSGETTPPFSSTPTDPRNGKVFIATGTFVTGSRPDVESAYPTTPASARAGWGYLMLTYGLWNRGNGTYTLYAFGVDQDGHVTPLGTRTITSNNATATKPFGSIDTPDQGATLSGIVTNFGWALTPGTTCTVAGGSVQVSIDSGPLQPVVYGGARADIAAAFPGYTDADAAGGSYTLDTTTLSNGQHTIGWYVTDSCGRADGIGSRFFTVANGSLTSAARASGPAPPAARAIAWTPIAARIDDGAWASIAATTTGDRVVSVAQDQRLELQVPAQGPLTGRQIVNGTERPLPIGSSLDAAAGVFRWQPAPGFLGRFDLIFVDSVGTATRVRVLVRPAR